jgi:hypothetical protein
MTPGVPPVPYTETIPTNRGYPRFSFPFFHLLQNTGDSMLTLLLLLTAILALLLGSAPLFLVDLTILWLTKVPLLALLGITAMVLWGLAIYFKK